MSDPDIANDTSTGAEIQLESFFDGVLEAHDDVDWIKVVITNAGTYEFTLMVTDGDLNDGYLILYDAEGIQLSLSDNGGGGAADVMQTTLQAGTYFLAAAAQGGVNAGTYHMTAALMQSNTAPTFSPEDTLTGVAEGTNAQYTLLDLLDNASDADNNDTLSIDGEVLVKDGDDSIIGTATLDEDTYTITLDDEDYNGDVFLSYTVTDGTDTVAGSATYNVSAVNDDPTGTAAVVADKVEDTPFSLTRAQLLANISDIEDADEDLTISIGAVTGGTFILNGTSGDYDFTPTTDFSGAASITYTVTDTDGGDIEVTSNFNIIAADLPNDDTTTAQVIVDGAAFTSLLGSNDDVDWVKVVITEAGTYAFDLALTDGGLNDGHMMLFDAGSNFLTYDGDSGPGLDPRIVVTLEPGTYYLDIDNNNAPAATYSLTATSVNDAPTNSGDISLTDTIEGASVTTTVTALLANADDIDAGDTLSIQDGEIAVTDGEGTIIGSASISGDDVTITLTDINYNGDVNLDYIITDGEATVAGSASYNLSPVNDAPTNSGNIALTDTIEGASVTTTVTALLANADDVDGDTLSIQDGEITVTDGDGTIIGSASISGNDVTITLDDINYNGVVNLDYVITDAESNLNGVPPSGDATVAGSASYNLSPVNDAPTVSGPVTLTGVDEGTDAVFTLADLLANASDVDHDVLSIAGSVSVFSGATLMGTASLDDDSYTISLPENFNGSIDLVYTVTDGEESYATSATYTVAAVNDAPTFGDEVTLTGVNEDTPAVFSVEDLLFGAEDVDLDGLSISGNAISVEDAKGNTIGSAVYDDGDFTITLDENYNGTVNLEYAVTDGDETVAGSATYEVASVNDGG
ncbi:beta strand repeat-containing protein, partial [Asticcacaulis biprosthecium]|uniref:beta strand repeat-containing protein n=1 Tax=Asticcacaulis biprosthecium TaxID=76891 RepID=UPI0005914D2E